MRSYRVFLSSPGDVADERALARRLLDDELRYDPFLRGRVTFEVVSWDNPAAPTPMPAALTPQEAVNRFGPKPSECDIVVVVLWSRLGTHLDVSRFRKPDGGSYLSGTEWEFEDALGAEKPPEVFVYRRVEEPKVGMKDPALAEKRRQYELVERFFEGFKNPEGSHRRSWTPYDTPTDFKERLASDLRHFLHERLGVSGTEPDAEPAPVWTREPYPGLRPFTFEEAPIFFGRDREVDALIARLRDLGQRFLAIVGASGTGKSSLVRAGLLPRLRNGAIEGSRHWPVLSFTPGATGDNPFLALAVELERLLPAPARRPPVEIAAVLAEAPERLAEQAAALLADRPAGAVLVLFIDQFEELFAPAAARHRGAFVELLARAAGDPRLRVLATLRADFLPACAAEPALAALVQTGTFVLGPPGPTALIDMIQRPAERAGLELEHGLADEILTDGGGDSGALPLVAFCLEELYRQKRPGRRLTLDAYHALGGLRGAIGRRAAALLEEVRVTEGTALDDALPRVFHALVGVDAAGTATRRRTFRDELAEEPPIPRLIETLTRGRLLLAEDAGGRAAVTLAHEALIEGWPALSKWLERERARLQRIQRMLLSLAAPEAEDREHAATRLGRIGPAAAEAVPALIAALGDADEDVRWNAAGALGSIRPAAAEALPALRAALEDPDKNVAEAAGEALERIRSTSPPVRR